MDLCPEECAERTKGAVDLETASIKDKIHRAEATPGNSGKDEGVP